MPHNAIETLSCDMKPAIRLQGLTLALLLMLIACSPSRRVVIDNRLGVKAEVAWGLQAERTPARPFAVPGVDTLYTMLDAEGRGRKSGLMFGEGRWNVNELDRLTSRLVFIEVRGADSSYFRVSGRDTIRQLLEDGIRVPSRSEIRIRVE